MVRKAGVFLLLNGFFVSLRSLSLVICMAASGLCSPRVVPGAADRAGSPAGPV